ncbi:hypothetical protein [Desulfurobacterium sp.]|uniref:hypothetical protein n=1 Tax=Desulfurobacterium sp. TaxID=2004706 RepID=UPI00260ED3B0|nr:hypothetical protein [Desulfurobacterium sp.]
MVKRVKEAVKKYQNSLALGGGIAIISSLPAYAYDPLEAVRKLINVVGGGLYMILLVVVVLLAMLPIGMGVFGFYKGYSAAKRSQDEENPVLKGGIEAIKMAFIGVVVAAVGIYFINDYVFQGQLISTLLSSFTGTISSNAQ